MQDFLRLHDLDFPRFTEIPRYWSNNYPRFSKIPRYWFCKMYWDPKFIQNHQRFTKICRYWFRIQDFQFRFYQKIHMLNLLFEKCRPPSFPHFSKHVVSEMLRFIKMIFSPGVSKKIRSVRGDGHVRTSRNHRNDGFSVSQMSKSKSY